MSGMDVGRSRYTKNTDVITNPCADHERLDIEFDGVRKLFASFFGYDNEDLEWLKWSTVTGMPWAYFLASWSTLTICCIVESVCFCHQGSVHHVIVIAR
jgi:hypothetical protein